MRASAAASAVVDLTSPSPETTGGGGRRRRSGIARGEDAGGVRREGGLDVGAVSAGNAERRRGRGRGNDGDGDDVCVVERPTVPVSVPVSAPVDVVFTGEKSPKRARRALSARGERRERALREGVFQRKQKVGGVEVVEGGNATAGKGKVGDGNATAGGGGGGRNLGRCAVCLEAYVNPTSTRCGHVFCARCIAAAIKHNGTCPTCRKRTTKKQCLRVYL